MKIERKLTGMIIRVDEDGEIETKEIHEDVIVEEMPWYIKHAPVLMVILGTLLTFVAPAIIVAVLSLISFSIVLYGIGKVIQLYWHERKN